MKLQAGFPPFFLPPHQLQIMKSDFLAKTFCLQGGVRRQLTGRAGKRTLMSEDTA